jgi:transposase
VRTLTDNDARLIAELFNDLNIPVKDIAEKFDIHVSTVEHIARRELYARATSGMHINKRPRGRHKLNYDKVREIRRMRAEGHSIHKIAEHFGVRYPTISEILHGRTWTFVE